MATNLSAIAKALAALETGVTKPVQAPRPTYAEARAELDARARAGETTMVRDSTGRFTAGVKISHFGPRPAAPVKVAKVEARRPVTVERERRASVVGLSVEA